MGAIGTKLEFERERGADLMRVYRLALEAIRPPFSMRDVVKLAISYPASCFWVSFERASWQVSRLRRGMPLKDVTSRLHTEMYMEIYRRCMTALDKDPDRDLADIVMDVISSPAPRFYVTVGTAMIWICRLRKQRSQ